MTTLILKRESKGYYTNQVNNIRIVVSEYNGEWTGDITDESKTIDGYELYKCYGSTKKEVVNQLINYLK